MASPSHRPRRPALNGRAGAEDGFVLVSVLAVLAVLGAVLTAATLQLRSATALVQARAETVRLQGLADGIARLVADDLDIQRTYRTTGLGLPENGSVVACPLGSGRSAFLSIQDQGHLIDLNTTPRPAMEEAFRLLGVPDAEALTLGAEIVDYRDPDDVPEPNGGAESAQYRARGLAWMPRNAPFVSVEEIGRLPSMTPALAHLLAPALTVYNPGGHFDLAALIGRLNPSAIRKLPDASAPVPSPRQYFRLAVVVADAQARAGRSAIFGPGTTGFIVWQQTVPPGLAAGGPHPACATIAGVFLPAPRS